MLMSNDIMRGTSSRFIAVLGKPVPMSGCSYIMSFLNIVFWYVRCKDHERYCRSRECFEL